MNKKIYLLLCLALTLLLPGKMFATHVMGADFEYQCLGKDSFYITVKVYKDCKGVSLSPITLNINPITAGCSWSKTGVTMTQVSCEDITPVCKKSCSKCDRQNCNAYGYPNGSNASCNFQYGMEKLIFKYLLVFPSNLSKSCCKFRATYEQCCRNGQITTCCADNNFFSFAEFDRCVKPCNSSPVLANDPVAILCAGNCICLNNGARDTADFDSLSYGLDKGLTAWNTSTTYNSPYTWNNPLQYKGFPKQKPNPAQQCSGFVLDSVTGDLCFTPTQQQVAVLVVNVYEWRRDSNGVMKKIGTTRRDMQLIIMANCTNKPPVIKGPFSQVVCAKEQVCFTDMVISDPDYQGGAQKDSVRVQWNYGIPKATFTKKWNGKNEYWTLCWQTTDNDAPNNSPKTYFFNVTAYDDACPLPGQVSRNFSITVKPTPKATRNYTEMGCGIWKLQSNPVEQYKNTISYEWTVEGIKYYTKDTIHKFNTAGQKIIKHRIEVNNCFTEVLDTIEVQPFAEVHLPNDTFMCKGDSMKLTAYSVNARPPYKFYWNSDTSASDSVYWTKTPIDSIIKVRIVDSTGCESMDSMIMDIIEPPFVDLGPDQRRCDGDSMLFDAGDNLATGNVSGYVWYDSTLAVLDTTRLHQEKLTRPLIAKVIDTAGCFSVDTVLAIFNPKVDLQLTDVAACEGDSVDISFLGADSFVVVDLTSNDTMFFNGQDTVRALYNNTTQLFVHGMTTTGGVMCEDWDTVDVKMYFPAIATIKRYPAGDLCPDNPSVQFYSTVLKDIKTNAVVSGNVYWIYQPDSLVRAAFDTTTGYLYPPLLGATYQWGSAIKSKYIHFKVVTSFGCILFDSVEIIINPKPPIKINVKSFCENYSPFKLNAYASPNAGPLSPDGETWQGTGVTQVGTDWYFNPNSATGGAGVGQHTLTYIWKDNQGYGCSDTDTVSFFVNPIPVITKNNPPPICNTDGIQDLWKLTDAKPLDGIFLGQGINLYDSATGLFDPTKIIPLTSIGASSVVVKIVFLVRGNGCPVTDTIYITVNPIPAVQIPPSRTICLDSAAWNLPGMSLPLSWWIIDDDSSKTANEGWAFNPSVWDVGNHKLVYYYTDPSTGCKNKDSMTITVQDTPWVEINTATPLCAGEPVQLSSQMKNATGVVWRSSTGGKFFQAGSSVEDSTTQTPVYYPTATDISQGFFTIMLMSTGNGFCNPSIDTMTFVIRPIPIPSFSGIPLEGCSPLQVFFTGNSSEPNCTYDWNFGDPESGGNNTSAGDTTSHIFTNNTPDTRYYDITLKVTSEYGCDSTIVNPQYVASFPIPKADFDPKPAKASTAMPRIRFQNLTSFVTDSAQYYWKFGDPEFGTSQEKNPTYWYSNTDTGTYIVWLNVITEHGCVDSISKVVKIGPEMTVFIPNAFSPDNAGPKKNNFFWVEADNYKGFEMSIYTRWGELVFYSNQRMPGWNGWFEGKPCQEDVYVYQVNIQNLEGKWFHYNGTVTLMR